MSGVPVWRSLDSEWGDHYTCEHLAAADDQYEPGVWFPLSARAELREQVSEVIHDMVMGTWTAKKCREESDAVLALIFGAEPDGGANDA